MGSNAPASAPAPAAPAASLPTQRAALPAAAAAGLIGLGVTSGARHSVTFEPATARTQARTQPARGCVMSLRSAGPGSR
jgi:hypothetical protein